MKSIATTLRALIGAALVAALPAQAALVGSAAELPPTPFAFTLTFDAPTGSALNSPVDLGRGVTFSTAGAPGSLGPAPLGVWALGPDVNGVIGGNGIWGGGKTFAGVDGDFGDDGSIASMTFSFAEPVRGVGGFMSFDPTYTYADPQALPLLLYIAALDADGNVLESYELPNQAPPGAFNDGLFYGIGRETADIAAFVIEGPFAVVDDLRVAAVPEPGTVALVLAGLLALGAAARRRG